MGDDFNRLGEFDLSELGENVASTITADQDLSDLDSDFSWDEVYQLESMESSAQELDSGHELSLDSGPESTGESMGERLQTEWLRATDETFEQQFYQALANEDFTASETTLLEQLLDALDEQYFLTLPVAEFAKQCRQPLARVSAFVERIKHLNPAGVASQSVAECLLAQLDNWRKGKIRTVLLMLMRL